MCDKLSLDNNALKDENYKLRVSKLLFHLYFMIGTNKIEKRGWELKRQTLSADPKLQGHLNISKWNASTVVGRIIEPY